MLNYFLKNVLFRITSYVVGGDPVDGLKGRGDEIGQISLVGGQDATPRYFGHEVLDGGPVPPPHGQAEDGGNEQQLKDKYFLKVF